MAANSPWKNPPLQEAIFEIRFPPVKDYTLMVAELINQNRELFPEAQTLPVTELPASIIIGGQVRHRFIGKKKDILFQTGPDTLSINVIRYSGFDKFIKSIKNIVNTASTSIQISDLSQINLRYINRFGNIKDPFSILNIASPFPMADISKTRGIQINYTKEENDVTYISTNIVFPVNNLDLILDINAFYTSKLLKKSWDLNSIIEWTNVSHNLVYENFESLIADREKEERK